MDISMRSLDDGAPWIDDDNSHYQPSRFKFGYRITMQELRTELDRIGVCDANIELDVPAASIRIDGGLRADAKVRGPRVRMTFVHPEHGNLAFSCDTFDIWKSNLRAICLTLVALRAVDRYGATRSNQQYAGFKALPGCEDHADMTVDRALEILTGGSAELKRGIRLKHEGVLRSCYRTQAKRLHPDAGGSEQGFADLERANRLISAAEA